MTTYVDEKVSTRKETMKLSVEDLVELGVEELEEVVAPALAPNHNETFVADLDVEEMEEVIAPGLSTGNHNETLVSDATC